MSVGVVGVGVCLLKVWLGDLVRVWVRCLQWEWVFLCEGGDRLTSVGCQMWVALCYVVSRSKYSLLPAC